MNLENIKTYEDICKIDNVDAVASLPIQNATTPEEIAINSFSKVLRINRVLNEGWVPDWNNWGENKYYPWFDMRDNAGSGSGFSSFDYYCDIDGSHVGSRLVFKTSDLAKFAGKTFLEEYKGFMK